jgi:hypothetical protein
MAKGVPDVTTWQIRLEGFMPIMFDRYAGDNKTQLPVSSKMYFVPGSKVLCLPATNLISFLSAKNTTSVAKLVGGRAYKALADAFLSYLVIKPEHIPLLREQAPITFTGFSDGRDEQAGIYVDYRVARLDKGIPNPKERPVVELPWELQFTLKMFRNDTFDETLLKTAFERGGIALGLGTYRGAFGKFTISEWARL